MQRVAHISDLLVGRGVEREERAEALCATLLRDEVDLVIATGDLTHRGLRSEWQTFEALFAPFIVEGRLLAVPGDHDRRGNDVAWMMMGGRRVETVTRPGLHLVRVDSAAPAAIDDGDLEAIDAALSAAPEGHLVVVALHHPLFQVRQPGRLARFAAQLGLGSSGLVGRADEILERLRGRCDLVLHGHATTPSATRVLEGARPLTVLSAGSSTELARAWVFGHEGRARVTGPMWIDAATGWLGPIGEIDPANDELLEELEPGVSIPRLQLAG